MRKPIPSSVKHRMRDDLIANCKDPTGFPERKSVTSGCGGYEDVHVRQPDGTTTRGSSVPRECRCWVTYSCMQRHADWGFDPKLFLHDIEDIRIGAGRKLLDDFVKAVPAIWGSGGGLYIYGTDIGCGKTTLAHLLTRRIYDYGANAHVDGGTIRTGGYKAWYMLSHEFNDRAWRSREGFQEQIAWGDYVEDIDLLRVKVFVLDEFGRDGLADERKVRSGRSFLEPFLRERMAAGLITIITGHMPPSSAEMLLEPQALSLLSQLPAVEVVGDDRRRPEKSPFFGGA